MNVTFKVLVGVTVSVEVPDSVIVVGKLFKPVIESAEVPDSVKLGLKVRVGVKLSVPDPASANIPEYNAPPDTASEALQYW